MKWLNEMAQKGYLLTKVEIGKYTFERTSKNVLIRLVYMPDNNEEFIDLIKESGGKLIDQYLNWGYFYKVVQSNEGFEIYSDLESKIAHVNRILTFSSTIFLCAMIGILLGFSNSIHSPTLSSSWKIFYLIIIISMIILYLTIITRLLLQKHHLKSERNIHE